MKRFNKLKSLICLVAIAVQCVCFVGVPASAEESSADIKSISLRIYQDHPGVYGHDVTYMFSLYGETEFDIMRLKQDDFTLYCNNKNIKIDGINVTVPASFKDNTDVQAVKIYARLNSNPEITTYFPLMIKNWKLTFADEFEGNSLNENYWVESIDTAAATIKSSDGVERTKANGVEGALEVSDGTLKMRFFKNTAGKAVKGHPELVPDYAGTGLSSQNKFSQTMGLFVSKIKVGTGVGGNQPGINYAYWLLPESDHWGVAFFGKQRSGDCKDSYMGEIDIVEYSAQWLPAQFQATDHWWTNMNTGHYDNAIRYQNEKLWTDYTEYATAWTPNGVYYYHNGVLIKQVKNFSSDLEERAFIRYSMGIPGYGEENADWIGYFTDEQLAQYDTTMYVDYSRVYK